MKKPQHFWQNRIQGYRLLVAAFILGSFSSFSLSAYELVDLGVGVSPKDLNSNLTVVGSRSTAAATNVAFRWTPNGGIEDIAVGTVANAINDNEQIAGNSLTGAFLMDGASVREWDGIGAYGINDMGAISGDKTMVNSFRPSPLPIAPAVYDGKSWTIYDIANVYARGTRQGVYADVYLLQDINNSGYAIGSWTRTGLTGSSPILIDTNAAVNSSADITYLPIPNGGNANAINNQNFIVGATGTNVATNSYAYAYLYDGASVRNLGTLHGGLTSSASDINDAGTVVGSAWLSTTYTSIQDPTQYHAFIWDEGNGMRDLNELVTAPNWILTSATAINTFGDIVGTGIVNGEEHGFLLTAAQIPSAPAVNAAPVAVATSDITRGRAPLMVNFSATGSNDPDGTIVSYAWDFGDGNTASGENVSNTYLQRGVYIAVLTVTDDQGLTSTAQIEIRVFKGR